MEKNYPSLKQWRVHSTNPLYSIVTLNFTSWHILSSSKSKKYVSKRQNKGRSSWQMLVKAWHYHLKPLWNSSSSLIALAAVASNLVWFQVGKGAWNQGSQKSGLRDGGWFLPLGFLFQDSNHPRNKEAPQTDTWEQKGVWNSHMF